MAPTPCTSTKTWPRNCHFLDQQRLTAKCRLSQVLALEALQLYAPMGHALGLDRLSATIEDICFQVHRLPAHQPASIDLHTPLSPLFGCMMIWFGYRDTDFRLACSQILFPASYSETAAQLRRTAISNEGTLRQCIAQLQVALSANAHLQTLTTGVEVGRCPSCRATHDSRQAAYPEAKRCLHNQDDWKTR